MSRNFGIIKNDEGNWGSKPQTMEIARLSEDMSNLGLGITKIDISDLGFSILANTQYIFEAVIVFESTQVAGGIRIGLHGPASPDSLRVSVFTHIGLDTMRNNAYYTYDSGPGASAVAHANNPKPSFVYVCVENGVNSGTLVPFFASSSGLSTVTVKSGSYAKLYTIM